MASTAELVVEPTADVPLAEANFEYPCPFGILEASDGALGWVYGQEPLPLMMKVRPPPKGKMVDVVRGALHSVDTCNGRAIGFYDYRDDGYFFFAVEVPESMTEENQPPLSDSFTSIITTNKTGVTRKFVFQNSEKRVNIADDFAWRFWNAIHYQCDLRVTMYVKDETKVIELSEDVKKALVNFISQYSTDNNKQVRQFTQKLQRNETGEKMAYIDLWTIYKEARQLRPSMSDKCGVLAFIKAVKSLIMCKNGKDIHRFAPTLADWVLEMATDNAYYRDSDDSDCSDEEDDDDDDDDDDDEEEKYYGEPPKKVICRNGKYFRC